MRLRLLLRGLLRAPAFALASIGTIALAVCLSSTVFAVVDGVLFKPLPYPEADELFLLGGQPSQGSRGPWSPADLAHLEAANPDVSITAYGGWSSWPHPSEAGIKLRAARVDARLFDVLGVRPLVGGFAPEDFTIPWNAEQPLPAMISYGFWRSYFGGDPGALGAVVEIPRRRIRVAGVLPPDFVFPDYRYSRIDLLYPEAAGPDDPDRWYRIHSALVRIAPAKLVEARARYDVALASTLHEYGLPSEPGETPYDRAALDPLSGDLGANERPFFRLAFLGAAIVVLIACINVTGLMFARTRARSRELRVRTALGASRRDISALVIGEVTIVTLCGAIIGFALTYPAFAVVQQELPSRVMLLKPPQVDWRVLAFALAAPLLTMLAFSFVPIARAFRDAPLSLTTTGTTPRGRSWASSSLLAFESGMGIAVLVIGTFVLASYVGLRSEPSGLDHQALAVINPGLPGPYDTAGQREAIQDRVLASIAAVPGVEGAAIIGSPLFQNMYSALHVDVPGEGYPETLISEVPVSSSFFQIAGLRVLQGRLPTQEEVERAAPLMVISLPAARALFEDRPAVGRTVTSGTHLYTVVGVVEDVRVGSQIEDRFGEAFTPIGNSERWYASYVFRPRPGERDAVIERVASAVVRDIEGARTERAEPLDTALAGTVRLQRFQASLFGIAGGAAALLLAVGVAGIVATSVRRRWREAGIRTALGASGGRIVRMLVADHVRPAAVGIALGLLASWWMKEALRSFLYQLEPGDLRLWASASVLVLAVVVVAAWLPARRAAHADPALVLRAE